MASRLQRAVKRQLVKVPDYVSGGIQYEVITGSTAYGMATDDSDWDIYGFCIPPKRIIFPHTVGYIDGFGTRPENFEQWSEHHVMDEEAQKEYDFTIFSIIKYFHLTMMCNPNMIDTLFVPQRCIIHSTKIGDMVRDQRKIFLNKHSWHTFKGYAYAQAKKMRDKNPEGKRKELVEKFGYDVKFGSHVVRLLNEIEQILAEGDLDLERNREQLKSIRRGDWTLDQIMEYFNEKERSLEALYINSTLPYAPRAQEVKTLLINCLEEYYGKLTDCVEKPKDTDKLIADLKEVIGRYE